MENLITIKTERLLLRTLQMADKEAFFQYRSMPEVYRYQSWKPKSIHEAEEFIIKNSNVKPDTEDTWLQLAVCLQDKMIGDLGIHFIDACQLEIGYTLSPQNQGHGYAAEAVGAVISHAFSQWKKHRITASVDPDNTKSIKLLERLGLRKEAHFVKSFWMDGQWCDDCIYAMLEDEWNVV